MVDTGKDVTWQALKYVSYCSTLTKQQIKDIYQGYLDKFNIVENAEENIVEFLFGKPFAELSLNANDQRLILVAGKFRKEVTSTIMWLLNHNVKVQCLKATPYRFENDYLLDIEQIIPIKEAEDFIIKMADKTREENEIIESSKLIDELRKQFWYLLLDRYNKVSLMYKNVNPATDHWLSCGSGVSGMHYNFIVTKSYVSTELLITKASQEESKKVYDYLYSLKPNIENDFGGVLIWERLDNKKASRITNKLFDVNVEKDDWGKIIEFLVDSMPRLDKALNSHLKKALK